ncbi:conserved exported hypothetical protein [Paraburkholderia piptadeniae]|uniref:Lipoprotein n=1 Tax=Paraburkholderia piptadeniae TaxID=1701573 RepID=A0A1N7SVI6_9BURK|nr:hypothetical protein [Paraburkholderia piptadeniae]SIT51476.1 conserved exported hypothetical protein [Paraburkholderia piptadeniae]
MMHTISFPHFRVRYAIAACSIALAATCAYQAPGLMQAILVVGANAQLPLERLAAEAASPSPVSSERERAQAQKADGDGRAAARKRREHYDVHGYERSMSDYKYWT